MTDEQITLRDELCVTVLDRVTAERVNFYEAAVACMGAAAVVLGALPPAARKQVADFLSASLLDHANRRAAEIADGSFDRRFRQ